MSTRLPDIKPGDAVKAEDFMALVKALREMQLTVSAPLQKRTMPSGTTLSFAALPGARLAKTTGAVTAMSGTTLGSGNIQLYSLSSAGVVAVGPTFSPSEVGWNLAADATTGPIISGVWVVVIPVEGLWLIIWVECT